MTKKLAYTAVPATTLYVHVSENGGRRSSRRSTSGRRVRSSLATNSASVTTAATAVRVTTGELNHPRAFPESSVYWTQYSPTTAAATLSRLTLRSRVGRPAGTVRSPGRASHSASAATGTDT